MSNKGAFSNGILSLTRALGNLNITGIPTEDDMQSIAEEVVSSSGGGGKYITSGFSAYNGHSAIGIGYSYTSYTQSSKAYHSIIVGDIQSDGIINGYGFRIGWSGFSSNTGYAMTSSRLSSLTPNAAIVF